MTSRPGEAAPPRPPAAARESLQGHYAGFASRFASFAVDLVVLTGIFLAVLAAINWAATIVTGRDIAFNRGNTWVVIAYLAWGFIYFAHFWGLNGRTAGEALFGVQVLTDEGGDVSYRRAVLRTLAFPLSFVILGLGFLGILLGDQRRALHDVIAGTVVVYSWDARAARLRFLSRGECVPGCRPVRPACAARPTRIARLTSHQAAHLGAQAHERGQLLGGDLVPRLGQVDRQVGADPARARGQDDDPVADVDALVDVVGDQQDGDAAGRCRSRRTRSSRSSRVCASTEPNGSSMSSRTGSQARARAMATRCCMPPDSCHGYLLRGAGQADAARASRAAPRRWARLRLGAAQRQRDVVPDGQPREQRAAVVLEHHGEPVGHRRRPVRRAARRRRRWAGSGRRCSAAGWTCRSRTARRC